MALFWHPMFDQNPQAGQICQIRLKSMGKSRNSPGQRWPWWRTWEIGTRAPQVSHHCTAHCPWCLRRCGCCGNLWERGSVCHMYVPNISKSGGITGKISRCKMYIILYTHAITYVFTPTNYRIVGAEVCGFPHLALHDPQPDSAIPKVWLTPKNNCGDVRHVKGLPRFFFRWIFVLGQNVSDMSER
jgi:hypothetical protein